MKGAQRGARIAASTAAVALPRAALLSNIELCPPIRRIVTVHSGSLRELLFALPALRALREAFEGARIAAVVREGLAPLLRSCALVDEVLVRPGGGLSSYAHLMARLHAQHCDVAIAFSISRNGVLLAWSSGAHVRLGFDGAKMDALLTHRVTRDESTPATIEAYLDLTRALGCTPRCHDYCDLIRPGVEEERKVAQWLDVRAIDREFILLAPQPETASKRAARPAETEIGRWIETARALSRRAPIVVVAPRSQKAMIATAQEYSDRSAARLFDAGGTFDTMAQATLFARARLFVGYTGGAMHLAAAMGTPVVALRSDSKSEADTPRGVSHRLLLGNATAEEIARAALEIIGL
jgi:ADP-heptose:LPS heptosyltransferase